MTDSINTRELVLSILLSILQDQEYSHLAISGTLEKYQYLPKQERSFITRLSEGTLENLIRVDYVINQFSNTKVNKMKPVIRTILRMSVYQILFMDRVPDSAACNEAVRLAEKKGFRNLKGFVNGVLRNIARNKEAVSYPDEQKEPVLALSVKYSMPEWMIRQWEKDYGREQMLAILEGFRTEGKLSIRTNLSLTTPEELQKMLEAEGVTVTPVRRAGYPDFNYAFFISGFDSIGMLPSFQQGYFSVQDISSMLVAETADLKAGDLVIDVCAAPGGKSLHMAEKLAGTGTVVARDLTEYKTAMIEQNVARLKTGNIQVMQWDARIEDPSMLGKADVVIADLPCSGLGVMRKKTDIRHKMDPQKEASLAELQREILTACAGYVKEQGQLIYSTCTMDRMENEDNTDWFLKEYPQFTLVSQTQMFPDEENGDGFYIAKFYRNNG